MKIITSTLSIKIPTTSAIQAVVLATSLPLVTSSTTKAAMVASVMILPEDLPALAVRATGKLYEYFSSILRLNLISKI